MTKEERGLQIRTLKQVVDWRNVESGSRLLLPPIQRSIAWDNQRLVDFWDSLFRGLPIGLFLIHRAGVGGVGRDANYRTVKTDDQSWMLFDGQQRLAALLLGFGQGPHAQVRRLYIDVDTAEIGIPELRINSAMQPFGYRKEQPNQKLPIAEIDDAIHRYAGNCNPVESQDLFRIMANAASAPFMKGSKKLIPLKDVLEDTFRFPEISSYIENALNQSLIFQEINPPDNNDYGLFFQRIGQGGVRLTDRELAYSLLKHQYPQIHDTARDASKSSFMFEELDLALAGLRLAKVEGLTSKSEIWKFSEASPKDARELTGATASRFDKLFPFSGACSPLVDWAKTIEDILRLPVGKASETHSGFPVMLLARFSRHLVDALIRIAQRAEHNLTEQAQTLRAFCLYWLLFVRKEDRAAQTVYRLTSSDSWFLSPDSLLSITREMVSNGSSYPLPSSTDGVISAIESLEPGYFPSYEQFGLGNKSASNPEADQAVLRHLVAARNEHLLLWIQRHYVDAGRQLDPAAVRLLGPDHRFDVDHLLPSVLFEPKRGRLLDSGQQDSLRHRRWWTRDCAGNLRYLDYRRNGERGDAPITEGAVEELPLLRNPQVWNRLIAHVDKNGWTTELVDEARLLVMTRAAAMVAAVLDAGLGQIAPTTTGLDADRAHTVI